MNWNRDLTQFESQILHDLHAKGYRAVDKKHMIHFRDIYDFISRFADDKYSGNVILSMSTGPVPINTMRIVNSIGVENLFEYFSSNVFESKFMNFCEKLIRTKKIRSVDYIADGTIIAKEIEAEECNA